MPPFPLRAYQQRILGQIGQRNGIVLLPTGAGKTAIASEGIRLALEHNDNKKVLFLVPTCLLVDQQAKAIGEWLGGAGAQEVPVGAGGVQIAKYSSEHSLPPADFRVLVSTPKAFSIAQAKHPQLLGWDLFALVVFDEVHHVLKEHPYRKIALKLRDRAARAQIAAQLPQADGAGGLGVSDRGRVQILGLTASLTYAVADSAIKKNVQQLMRELDVTVIGTADAEELAADGYHGNSAVAERPGTDVEDGLVTLSDESDDRMLTGKLGHTAAVISIDGGDYTQRIRGLLVPEPERKPHMMLATFWERVKCGRCTPFAGGLLKQIRTVEQTATLLDGCFASPLGAHGYCAGCDVGGSAKPVEQRPKKSARLEEWGKHVNTMRGRLCSSRLPLIQHYWVLEQLYEALRILIVSWEENQEGAIMFLKMMLEGNSSAGGGSSGTDGSFGNFSPRDFQLEVAFPQLHAFLLTHDCADVYLRLGRLKSTLLRKFQQHEASSAQGFRGLVFVQQRVTTHVLVHFLLRDAETRTLLRCAPLYATSSPATPSLAVTKAAARETLRRFAAGEVNLLICTVVAEEGMDVPAANCVVRFDAVQNAVSHVQGRGRARQADSSFVVLRERPDRCVEALEDAGRRQMQIATEVARAGGSRDSAEKVPTAAAGVSGTAGGVAGTASAESQAERSAQLSRERGARALLEKQGSESDEGAVASLNLWTKKTKALLEERLAKVCDGEWECVLEYSSCLRVERATGKDAGKKNAKSKAALAMMLKLKAEVLGVQIASSPM